MSRKLMIGDTFAFAWQLWRPGRARWPPANERPQRIPSLSAAAARPLSPAPA